jgi:hypothetical protein
LVCSEEHPAAMISIVYSTAIKFPREYRY